jgi:hypothetical protein
MCLTQEKWFVNCCLEPYLHYPKCLLGMQKDTFTGTFTCAFTEVYTVLRRIIWAQEEWGDGGVEKTA